MDLAHGGLKILKTNPKPLKLHKVPKIKTWICIWQALYQIHTSEGMCNVYTLLQPPTISETFSLFLPFLIWASFTSCLLHGLCS
jgi:hypothetical protein